MKVYVAGASSDAEIVAGLMRQLRERHVYVAFDWTAQASEAQRRGEGDAHLSDEEASCRANIDTAGVIAADVLWLVLPRELSIGCWVELGIAIASGARIVVSGPNPKRTIFTQRGEIFETHEAALRHITLGVSV